MCFGAFVVLSRVCACVLARLSRFVAFVVLSRDCACVLSRDCACVLSWCFVMVFCHVYKRSVNDFLIIMIIYNYLNFSHLGCLKKEEDCMHDGENMMMHDGIKMLMYVYMRQND
jgi:hypothetical protein